MLNRTYSARTVLCRPRDFPSGTYQRRERNEQIEGQETVGLRCEMCEGEEQNKTKENKCGDSWLNHCGFGFAQDALRTGRAERVRNTRTFSISRGFRKTNNKKKGAR